MSRSVVVAVLQNALALILVAASASEAAQLPTKGGPGPVAADGEALYSARCAACHEQGDGRAPTRARIWPAISRDKFNLWALNTFASHPKGFDPAHLQLKPPPEGYACRIGSFTDLY